MVSSKHISNLLDTEEEQVISSVSLSNNSEKGPTDRDDFNTKI